MSLSLKTTSAVSFQAYVQEFYDELLTELLVGFKSGQLFTNHEGVKGRIALTNLTTDDLVRRYSSTFAPVSDAIVLAPRNLVVTDAKVDIKIIPKEFESSYLGQFRKKGQDSMDLPFEGAIIKALLGRVQQEMEYGIWRGKAAQAPQNTDKLIALFDGIKEIIKTEITGSNLTPITTGAITSSNAVASVELTYAGLGDAYQAEVIDIFMNPKDEIKFMQDYRDKYGKYTAPADGTIKLDIGRAQIHVLSGVPVNCLLITPKENIHYGYDGPMDASMFNFEQEDRSIKMWMDFKMGVNFGIVNDNLIAVNNQWTV